MMSDGANEDGNYNSNIVDFIGLVVKQIMIKSA